MLTSPLFLNVPVLVDSALFYRWIFLHSFRFFFRALAAGTVFPDSIFSPGRCYKGFSPFFPRLNHFFLQMRLPFSARSRGLDRSHLRFLWGTTHISSTQETSWILQPLHGGGFFCSSPRAGPLWEHEHSLFRSFVRIRTVQCIFLITFRARFSCLHSKTAIPLDG